MLIGMLADIIGVHKVNFFSFFAIVSMTCQSLFSITSTVYCYSFHAIQKVAVDLNIQLKFSFQSFES